VKKDGSIINLVFVDGIHLQVRDEDKKGSRLVMGGTTTQQTDTQHNGTQQNDIQHNGLICETQHN
jgi:hypothetical protein